MTKTKLKIHTWPEAILRKKSRSVRQIDKTIKEYLDEMAALMKISDGVGLAANQVGLDLKLIVIEVEDKLFKLVNPQVTSAQGQICFLEGCLSFPGLELKVKRHNKISVSALDYDGNNVRLELEGMFAVIFQHEIDHTNGVVFLDRISFLQRLWVSKQLKEIKKKTKNGMCK